MPDIAFKIYEDGIDSSGQWGVDRLIANKGKVSFTIPSCIPAGQYLLRAEIIALHAASSYPGAQLYVSQIRIFRSDPALTFRSIDGVCSTPDHRRWQHIPRDRLIPWCL